MARHKTAGWILFGLGTAVLGGTVVLGKVFMPELQRPSPLTLEAIQGTAAMAKLAAFGSSFPLGLGLAISGAALLGAASGRRAALLGAAALALIGLSRLVPGIFGTERSPLYFGGGGVLILILLLLTAHAWSQRRRRLPARARGGADLQALGYLCFGIASWYVCGAGGMPGFALSPERMAAVGSHWFVVANYKVAMAFISESPLLAHPHARVSAHVASSSRSREMLGWFMVVSVRRQKPASESQRARGQQQPES